MTAVCTATNAPPANSTPAAGGAGLGTTARGGAPAGGFSFLLGNCLAGEAGQDQLPERKRAADDPNSQDGEQVAPVSVPVQAVVAQLAAGWGLAQQGNTADVTATPDPGVPAAGVEDPFPDSGLAGSAGMVRASAGESALLRGGPAGKTSTETLDVLPELAFGARLRSSEPPTPASGSADAPLDPTVAGSAPPVVPAASLAQCLNADHGSAAEGANTPVNSPVAGGQHDNPPLGGCNAASPENSQTSSAGPEDGGTQPAPVQRNPNPFSDRAPKDAGFPAARPRDNRSEATPAARTAMEGASNPLTPAAADPEAQPDVPAQETRVTPPADVEPPEPAAPPVSHDVSLHLSGGDSSVDIRMAERAGEIRVTVHTPDHDLANSLRADLPDLVGKLRQNGFQTEVWRPAAMPETGRRNDFSGSQEHSPDPRRDGRERQAQQQPKKQSQWAGAWKESFDPAKESNL